MFSKKMGSAFGCQYIKKKQMGREKLQKLGSASGCHSTYNQKMDGRWKIGQRIQSTYKKNKKFGDGNQE